MEGDVLSNSLIVTANKENLELIKGLVQNLDKDAIQIENMRIVPLQHATAQRLSSTLTTLLQRALSSGGQQNRTVVLPDPRTNSLLIAASDANSKLLDELIAKLDKPFDNPNLEPQIITLEQNDGTE